MSEPITGRVSSVWDEVQAERERAHAKHGDTSMEALPVDDLTRLTVLMEEVGEVARWFNENRHGRDLPTGDLRQELIQVAAMAGAWADALGPCLQARLGRSHRDVPQAEGRVAVTDQSGRGLTDESKENPMSEPIKGRVHWSCFYERRTCANPDHACINGPEFLCGTCECDHCENAWRDHRRATAPASTPSPKAGGPDE